MQYVDFVLVIGAYAYVLALNYNNYIHYQFFIFFISKVFTFMSNGLIYFLILKCMNKEKRKDGPAFLIDKRKIVRKIFFFKFYALRLENRTSVFSMMMGF